MIIKAVNHLNLPFGYATTPNIAQDLLSTTHEETVYIITKDVQCAVEDIHKLGLSSGVVVQSIKGESLLWVGKEPTEAIKETIRVLVNGEDSSCRIAQWRRFSSEVERFISDVILPEMGDCDESKDVDFQHAIESAKLILSFTNEEKSRQDLVRVAFDISTAFNQANKP